MYCEKCRVLFKAASCPVCGRDRRVRLPRPEDPCLLIERQPPYIGMLCDVLDQNGIPHLVEGFLGAGLSVKVGSLLETQRVYVRYDQLEAARAIADELFGQEENPTEK